MGGRICSICDRAGSIHGGRRKCVPSSSSFSSNVKPGGSVAISNRSFLSTSRTTGTINPDGVYGQIQGGVAQGLGYALYENLEIENSVYKQRTLEALRLPLSVDVPRVEVVLLEHPEAEGPYGARGVVDRRRCCRL